MTASLGFDGIFKPDNWTPVYVTLADEQRRAGTIEVRVAHGRLGHDVVARVVANPREQTFTLYAPLGSLDRAQVQFRDAAGKLIASSDLSDDVQKTPAAFGGFAVGVSGEPAAARRVAGELVRDTGEYTSAGVVAARLLPERAIGYRAVDALVIAGLDTDATDDRVEQAIVDWVRAGGVLIAWPGAQRPTQSDAPLAALLPADEGDLTTIRVEGRELIVRSLARRDGAAIADLSVDGATTYRRRVGLGQIVYTNVDPTLLPNDIAVDAKLARWRRLTENEFSLLPDDRRKGVFDPLVAQSLAEQSVRAASPPTSTDWRPWLWGALAAGLLLGPGEIAMLAIARQRPRVPYTAVGLLVIVAAGGALFVPRSISRVPADRASLTVVGADGPAVEAWAHASGGLGAPGTNWLGGDASDPTRQPAGAARVTQRELKFETSPKWVVGSEARPIARSLAFAAEMTAGCDPSRAPTSGAAAILARPRELVRDDGTAVVADDPATVRVETGIERLAADPAWAAIFLDRTIAARLVRLQESEGVTIAATKAGEQITLRVDRP